MKGDVKNAEIVDKPEESENLALTAVLLRRPSMWEYAKGTNYYKRNDQEYRNIIFNSEPVMSTDPADNGRMWEVATTNPDPNRWRPPVDRSGPALEDISEELAAKDVTGRVLVPCIPREIRNLPKKAGVKKEAIAEEDTGRQQKMTRRNLNKMAATADKMSRILKKQQPNSPAQSESSLSSANKLKIQ